jgi:quinoprotein glucose dehydrogenase
VGLTSGDVFHPLILETARLQFSVMLKSDLVSALVRGLFLSLLLPLWLPAADVKPADPKTAIDPELAIKQFKVPPGFKVELFAAEPQLANPVAFCFDEQGKCYVAETFRLHAGVTDIRGHMNWLDDDLASRTTEDLAAMFTKFLGPKVNELTNNSERVRLIEDRDGNGRADFSTTFAEGFNSMVDGIGAGVLARKGNVWFANIPNLWLLRDTNRDGQADFRKSLHHGYGVRVGFLGHDLHGLRFGPDGKLYFSIGDRGANVKTPDGKTIANPETGAVYRCNPDGSELEIFAYGLRNPQELAFDDYGNLFTGDNNSDGGDQARWVHLIEGGDSGWHVGWQFIDKPNSRGPWSSEKMWHSQNPSQPAYILPPITNLANGPSGLAFYPGTGLPDRFNGHFFLVDFRGSTAGSGVHTFALKPKGATFELVNREDFIWHILATDVEFGVNGGLYVSDWVEGWDMTGKGRIYRVFDPAAANNPIALQTKKLLAEGMEKRPLKELATLLAHRDQRVRQEAQFALAEKGDAAVKTLTGVARKNPNQLARLHAIWGLGQIVSHNLRFANSKSSPAAKALLPLLGDKDAEVRAQAAKVLGEVRAANAFAGLVKLLNDESPRTRFFAAIALGKLGRKEAVAPLLAMLRANADTDVYLRHAGVMGLAGIADKSALLSAAKDNSSAVRMGVLLAMRRLQFSEVAWFLNDSDPALVLEAARAINDFPINEAMPQLAALIDRPTDSEPLLRRVLNANFRLGTSETAASLARYAARNDALPAQRAEALQELGDWAKPSGRDQVVGLWRPLPPRDGKIAAEALRPVLTGILQSSPDNVRMAAIYAVEKLLIPEAGPTLFALIEEVKLSAKVRTEALKTLAQLKDARLPDALKLALADSDETLRKEANRLQAETGAGDVTGQLTAVLENGTVTEKQGALISLGKVEGNAADKILAEWLDRLLAGKAPAELQFELLEAAAKRSSPIIKEKLQQYETSRAKNDDLAAYRELLFGGDATAGRQIFFERPEASCVRCHKIGAEGGEVGPVLDGIGAKQSREYLLESILYPNKTVAPGFESVLVTMKNGTLYAGIVKGETDTELEINSPEDGIVKIKKPDIQSREKGLSAMLPELDKVLSRKDLRDLVAFLTGLK